MKSLFAIAINGTMLYFEGNIPPNMYKDIDMLSKQVAVDPLDTYYTDFCTKFIMLAKEKYNIELNQMKIAYVFRPLVK